MCYRRFILYNRVLSSKWSKVKDKIGYDWLPFSQEDLDGLLELEREHLGSIRNPADELYCATNSRLPFRITMTGSKNLLFRVHHGITSGKPALAWVNKWLSFYVNAENTVIPEGEETIGPVKIRKKAIAVLNAMIYYTGYIVRHCMQRAEIMDLSGGRTPKYDVDLGYSVKTYAFSEADTMAILSNSKRAGLTFSEYSAAVLIKGFFEFYPTESRISVSVATDIQPFFSVPSHGSLGNYTENVYMHIAPKQNAKESVKNAFRWIRRGGRIWLLYGFIPYCLKQDC